MQPYYLMWLEISVVFVYMLPELFTVSSHLLTVN